MTKRNAQKCLWNVGTWKIALHQTFFTYLSDIIMIKTMLEVALCKYFWKRKTHASTIYQWNNDPSNGVSQKCNFDPQLNIKFHSGLTLGGHKCCNVRVVPPKIIKKII